MNIFCKAADNKSIELCEEATKILRSHRGVPPDFEAKVAVRADVDAVKNAREAASSGRCSLLLFYFPPMILISLCTGFICSIRKTIKILDGWVQDAEEDIYVYGDGGFAVLNGGKVKEWNPTTKDSDLFLYPSEKTFFYRSGAHTIRQPVLIVQRKVFGENKRVGWGETQISVDVRLGKTKQIWFVGRNDYETLPFRCAGGEGFMNIGNMNTDVTSMMQNFISNQ